MTEEQLLNLIKEVGINQVIKKSLGEGFPYTSNQIIEIYNKHKDDK